MYERWKDITIELQGRMEPEGYRNKGKVTNRQEMGG